jgi:hypothetical protein
MSPTTSDAERFLRLVLRANAMFVTFSALLLVLAPGPVADFLRIFPSGVVAGFGVLLFAIAVWIFWFAGRSPLPVPIVRIVIAMDVLWPIANYALLLVPPAALTTQAKWAIAMTADVVALFAVLQVLGLRRLLRAAQPARS